MWSKVLRIIYKRTPKCWNWKYSYIQDGRQNRSRRVAFVYFIGMGSTHILFLLFWTENLIIFLFFVNLRSIWNQMEKYTLYWNFRVQHLKVILNFISLAYIAHSTCNLNFRSTFEYVKPMHWLATLIKSTVNVDCMLYSANAVLAPVLFGEWCED